VPGDLTHPGQSAAWSSLQFLGASELTQERIMKPIGPTTDGGVLLAAMLSGVPFLRQILLPLADVQECLLNAAQLLQRARLSHQERRHSWQVRFEAHLLPSSINRVE